MQSYHRMLKRVLSEGVTHKNRTGIDTLSVFGEHFRHDMRSGFPLLTTKKMHLRPIAEELFWFISGSTDVSVLQSKHVTIWDEWVKEDGTIGPGYGKQWRNFGGVDQFQNLLDGIEKDPSSRRLILNSWNPVDLPEMKLPPCHVMFQIKISEAGMSLCMYQRSADLFLGVPFNIASYALLLKILSNAFGYVANELHIFFGDLHIYQNHHDAVVTQLSRDPLPLPTLEIDSSLANKKHEGVYGCKYEHLRLLDYKSYEKISAEVAV